MSNLSALVGAILFAWLPEEETPHQPGPKFRPVFVLDVDSQRNQLLVAYGTSQRTERPLRGEITFRASEIQNLPKDTKFVLKKSIWIPMTNEYLQDPRSNQRVSVLGRLPNNRATDFLNCLRQIGIAI